MTIAFLHLSDIHFLEQHCALNNTRAEKIADSLRELKEFDEVFIIVSGDNAFSGKINEYKQASDFLYHLSKKIADKYKLLTPPHHIIVPGNHDVVLDPGLTNDMVQDAYRSGTIFNLIEAEKTKQSNYYGFARQWGCSSLKHELFLKKNYVFVDKKIEFRLINSALFSMHAQEKGLHCLPENVISQISETSDADYVFTVMHHSFHWFHDLQKTRMERSILTTSNAVFLGHEHDSNIQRVIMDHYPQTYVFAGGMLANKNDWSSSQFSAFKLNLITNSFLGMQFAWDNNSSIYIGRELIPPTELLPHIKVPFTPKEEFLAGISLDPKRNLRCTIDQFFTFPRLQVQTTGLYTSKEEINTEQKFIEIINQKQCTYISGEDNSGKTTLLYWLISKLYTSKWVVFCRIEDITSGNRKRIIKNRIEEIYGDNPAIYSHFEQSEPSNRIIIIDDAHKVANRSLFEFLSDIEKDFANIVLFGDKSFELDIMERFRTELHNAFYHLRIMPFYVDCREKLIDKLVPLLTKPEDDHLSICNDVAEALSNQRKFTQFTPSLIIQFTEYYCKNRNEVNQNDGSIFGKVFEANITNRISPHASKNMGVDKIFTILNKIAYRIHVTKTYPLPEMELINVIEDYKVEYGTDFSSTSVINILINAKILALDPSQTKYYFVDKSHLAYFVAGEIKRRYQDTGDLSDVQKVLELSCFGINSDILILLTYIADDIKMLNNILNVSLKYVEEWPEFSIEEGNLSFITGASSLKYSSENVLSPERKRELELQNEKVQSENTAIDISEIYDFNDEDAALLLNQIIRALSLLVAVSKCLPNFEHVMRADVKERFVKAVYELPQKLFYRWGIEIENNLDQLLVELDFIQQQAQKTNPTLKLKTKEQLLEELRRMAVSMYLNILFIPVTHAVKPNTIDYLDRFDRTSKATYQIMHTMMLERLERIDNLITECASLDQNASSAIISHLIRQILGHSMLHSKKMSIPQMQRIEDKFFDGGKTHQERLVQRKKLLKK